MRDCRGGRLVPGVPLARAVPAVRGMKPLPEPLRDGDGLASLAELLNMDATGFRLLAAWRVAAFIPTFRTRS